jgi:spore coat polysaccharide biosynthesis protein SpsF (cytidylyltransferase family)
MKTNKLKEICKNKNTNDTEIIWLSFLEDETIKSSLLQDVPDIYYRPEIRATLDYKEDLFFFEAVINHFWEQGKQDYTLKDIISFIDLRPEIALINGHRNIDWLNNQKKLNKTYRNKNV